MPSQEIKKFCDGFPPQGLSEARRGRGVSGEFFSHLIRRGGVPPGAAAFIIMDHKSLTLTDFPEPGILPFYAFSKKNLKILCDGFPPQGLSGARRGNGV